MDPLTRPEWRAGVNQVLGGFWTPYTPIVTASTTSPSGWVTTGGWYRVGATVVARFALTAGSSVSAGSGTYRVSLPVDAMTGDHVAGTVWLLDSSTGNAWNAQAWIAAAGYAQIRYGAGGVGASVTGAAPWTWASGDTISGLVMFETAAP